MNPDDVQDAEWMEAVQCQSDKVRSDAAFTQLYQANSNGYGISLPYRSSVVLRSLQGGKARWTRQQRQP